MRTEKEIHYCISALNAMLEPTGEYIAVYESNGVFHADLKNLTTRSIRQPYTGSQAECYAYLEGLYEGLAAMIYAVHEGKCNLHKRAG